MSIKTLQLTIFGRKIVSEINIESYFTRDKIKTNSFIYRWNLNNTPPSAVDRVLIMAELINTCYSTNYAVNLRPDKRLRAKGLYVLFANQTHLPE